MRAMAAEQIIVFSDIGKVACRAVKKCGGIDDRACPVGAVQRGIAPAGGGDNAGNGARRRLRVA